MKHFGPEPPWGDPYSRYGCWEKGEELWDGSGYVWALGPRRYAPSLFLKLMEALPMGTNWNRKIDWLEDELFPITAASA